LSAGQESTVYVTGTGSYYISNNSNSNVASEQISGSSIVITALTAGSANVSICQSGGQCATLYINVSGTTNSTSTSQLLLSQTSLSLTPTQQSTVYITGAGNYYISSNSTPSVASAQITGNSIVVSAIGYGTDNISICQDSSQCVSLSVSVLNSTTQSGSTTTEYVFPRYLGYGDKGDDVLKLQKLLSTEGYLSATPNGHYGPATVVAVKKFQKANKMSQTGNVGPATKAALNKLLASSVVTDTTETTKDQQVSAVQQAIQKLQAQLSAISGQ
jgi:ferredoxin